MAIIKVENQKQLKQFILFPNTIYKKDSNYVIHNFKSTYKQFKKIILKEKKYFALLYVKNNLTLGRVLYYYGYDKTKGNVCYFSQIDFIDNYKVVKEIFKYIEQEMQSFNIKYLIGPIMTKNLLDDKGVLIQGFDFPPMVFNGYNKEYYSTNLENYGFTKLNDFLTLKIDTNKKMPIVNDVNLLINRRYSIKIVKYDKIKNGFKLLKNIYSQCNSENNDEVLESNINFLKSNYGVNNIYFAIDSITGEGLAYVISLPDVNEILIKRKGKGSNKISKRKVKKIKGLKSMVIAIVPQYQKTDLGIYLYSKILDDQLEKGIKKIEIGPIDEHDNYNMKMVRKIGGEISHVYRLYEKEIISNE